MEVVNSRAVSPVYPEIVLSPNERPRKYNELAKTIIAVAQSAGAAFSESLVTGVEGVPLLELGSFDDRTDTWAFYAERFFG